MGTLDRRIRPGQPIGDLGGGGSSNGPLSRELDSPYKDLLKKKREEEKNMGGGGDGERWEAYNEGDGPSFYTRN